MKLTNSLILGLLAAAGCSGGDSDDPDAMVIVLDSSTGNGDASIVDAMDGTDATPQVDAATPQVDAATPLVDASNPILPDAMSMDSDSGVEPIQECIDTCNVGLACFDDNVTPEEVLACAQECTTDSLDCSAKQVVDLGVCTAAAPGPNCSSLIGCITAIGCFEQL